MSFTTGHVVGCQCGCQSGNPQLFLASNNGCNNVGRPFVTSTNGTTVVATQPTFVSADVGVIPKPSENTIIIAIVAFIVFIFIIIIIIAIIGMFARGSQSNSKNSNKKCN